MSPTVLLNVSLLPSVEVIQRVIGLSAELETIGEFILDHATRLPHLTLYMARLERARVDKAVEAVETLLDSTSPLELTCTGALVTDGQYVELSYVRTSELVDLQHAVVDRMVPMRYVPEDYASYYETYFGPYSDEQRENVRTSGYDLMGDLFRPHITLTRLRQNAVASQTLEALRPEAFSCRCDTVAILEADDLGAGRQLLQQHELGGSWEA